MEPTATQPLTIDDNINRKFCYYTHDITKNVCELLDGAEIIATYDYTPFGDVTTNFINNNLVNNHFAFSSEYYDVELELIYYNYRHYNPTDGRWLSRDPIAEQGGMNLYNFVQNNAISQIDILGLEEKECDKVKKLANVLYNETASIISNKIDEIRLVVGKISIKNKKNAGSKKPKNPNKNIYEKCCEAAQNAIKSPNTEWDFYILHNVNRHGEWTEEKKKKYGLMHGFAARNEYTEDKKKKRIIVTRDGKRYYIKILAPAVMAIQSKVIECSDSNGAKTYVMYQKKPKKAQARYIYEEVK